MSVVRLHSAHIAQLEAREVIVEVDISQGLYSFSIVGLPDKAIDESKDRVIAAIKNTGLRNPKTENQKVTVSLAPADVKKKDLTLMCLFLLHICLLPSRFPLFQSVHGLSENYH